MKTKATPVDRQMKALARLCQFARTHAGDLQACGRSAEARAMNETADWLYSLLAMLREDGRGLPVYETLF